MLGNVPTVLTAQRLAPTAEGLRAKGAAGITVAPAVRMPLVIAPVRAVGLVQVDPVPYSKRNVSAKTVPLIAIVSPHTKTCCPATPGTSCVVVEVVMLIGALFGITPGFPQGLAVGVDVVTVPETGTVPLMLTG